MPHIRFKYSNSIIFACLALGLYACQMQSDKTDLDYQAAHSEYQSRLQMDRDHYLKLIGLHPLANGKTDFGSKGDICIVANQVPDVIGDFIVNGDQVTFIAQEGVQVKTVDNDSLVVSWQYDMSSQYNSDLLKVGDLEWQVLQRVGSIFLRVKDQNNPLAKSFKGYQSFALHKEWIFEGQFLPFDKKDSTSFSAVEKEYVAQGYVGYLMLEIKKQKYQLLLGEAGFLMVGDLTNDVSTYGGGRYLDLDLSDSTHILIDFNRLYNPPCVFSKYTTCPVPSLQNRLPLKIEAGELLKGK